MMSVIYLIDKILVHFHKIFIKLTSSIAIAKRKASTPFILSPFLEKLILATRKIGLNFVDMSDNESRMSALPNMSLIHPALVIHFLNLKKSRADGWWVGGANNVLRNRMFIEYLH